MGTPASWKTMRTKILKRLSFMLTKLTNSMHEHVRKINSIPTYSSNTFPRIKKNLYSLPYLQRKSSVYKKKKPTRHTQTTNEINWTVLNQPGKSQLSNKTIFRSPYLSATVGKHQKQTKTMPKILKY